MKDKIKQAKYNRQYRAAHRDELRLKRRQSYVAHKAEENKDCRQRSYRNGAQPMSDNRLCSSFLGVHVAEQVLVQLFKDVVKMPYGNPGFDFKCANGYEIDVKAACMRLRDAGSWGFHIDHNTIADFFLCIAFDNREELNPQHVWLIPGEDISHLKAASISRAALGRWAQYEKPLGEVISCCDAMKTV
jgi:hypothetical protein